MQLSVIPNGIDLDKWQFRDRRKGFNVGFVGNIGSKKGIPLLLQIFFKLELTDYRYRLHIAGQDEELRYLYYFNYMLDEFCLHSKVIKHGKINDMQEFYDDMSYILCTSPWESQNVSAMEAMACGIKPVIHNFPGAKDIYLGRYLFNTIDEAVNKIVSPGYCAIEYREFVQTRYSLKSQVKKMTEAIGVM